jgi:acetyl-CoA C-acetyltransferase
VKLDPRTPVIVGAGQVVSRDVLDREPCEPVALIARALRRAGEDSGAGERLLRRADSVRCVPVLGWQYQDAAALVAEDLGVHPRETAQSAAIGGDGPQVLVNDTARAIVAGELDVALLGGGEAIASLRSIQRSGRDPLWRRQPQSMRPTRQLGRRRSPTNQAETAAGLAPPVFMYALIESAVRAGNGSARDAHLARIAALWSRFSEVAAENPHAWIRRRYTQAQIATPAPDNRLVSAPYTKLLTANIQVNMASGLILASAQAAEQARVPRDSWVFIHSGARAQERWHVSERERFAASRAVKAAARAALSHAGAEIGELAHVDLYSCFPAAVEIAARELGLAIDDPTRPLTVTGGLTFAGGPGNNYAAHAIATLVQRLREDPRAYGIVTAVGWYLTKHAVGVYSARPPSKLFESLEPRPRHPPARRVLNDYAGPATLEAYTVAYRRDGSPEAAIISALTARGERTLIRTPEPEILDALLAEDPIGWAISVAADRRVTIDQRTSATAPSARG